MKFLALALAAASCLSFASCATSSCHTKKSCSAKSAEECSKKNHGKCCNQHAQPSEGCSS